MIGISISLYDKFDDLGVLLDIIRHNWEDEYYVSVCSNHPDAPTKIEPFEDEIDHFEQGAQIEYDPSMEDPRGEQNLYYRIYDTIRRAARAAISADGVEYVFHLHTDAWPLSESSLQSLVEETADRDAAVAFPAKTHSFLKHYPPGSFGDQYILFDAAKATEVDFFEREPLDFPPTLIHQILPILCLAKFGWGELYHYTNCSNRQHWDGKPSTEIRNSFRPMFYDPTLDYLHVATEDFRGDLGKSLQAQYLARYGIRHGERVEHLRSEHELPEDVLSDRLDAWFDDLDDRLKWYGASVDTFGRDIRIVRSFLEADSRLEQLKLLAQHKTNGSHAQEAIVSVYAWLRSLVADNTSEEPYPVGYNVFPDRTLHDHYHSLLHPEDFPAEIREAVDRNFGDE
ncbi:hypothetical protein [Haloarcula sp. CGMCC 1.2071]|uniref:hypothetical protein n=1 Tax=Haloarcula sp. CGMCC 1.2071 TaxID=3111454 RepID=UPI00300F2303